MIVVGIDPDSHRHGVAFYEDGKLKRLHCMDRVQIIEEIRFCADVLISIEDVLQNNFIYRANVKSSKSAQSKVGIHIGRCQQAQTELMRDLDYYNIPYVLHKPQKGNWAKDKNQFEKVTGWSGRSNSDTRSAAFFGYLGLKHVKS